MKFIQKQMYYSDRHYAAYFNGPVTPAPFSKMNGLWYSNILGVYWLSSIKKGTSYGYFLRLV